MPPSRSRSGATAKSSAVVPSAFVNAITGAVNPTRYRPAPAVARSARTSPCSTTSPLCTSATSSHSSSTLPMSCVDSTTVVPWALRSSRIASRMRAAFTGSNPLSGSSRMRTRGWWMTAAMNCTFWAIPLLKSETFRFHHPSTPSRSNQPRSRRSASARSRPLNRAKYNACSPTRIPRYNPRSSGK